MKYLKIILILLLFIISNTVTLFSQSLGIKTTIVTNARTIPRFMYGVDLDGSTEYISNASPVNLDLNGANTITSLGRNSTFEDNATDWATNGTHVVSVDGTSKLTGTYSGKIAASGVGDSTTNFASLATDKYTTIVSGTKYTLQIQVRAVLADTDVTLVIGGKAKVFTAVDQTSEILVYNFEATSAEVGQKIIVYFSQADDVFIDEVDLSEAYDITWNVWTKRSDSTNAVPIFSTNTPTQPYYALHHINEKLRFEFDNASTAPSYKNLNGVADVSDDNWHLITIILNRTDSIKAYVDGVFEGGSVISNYGVFRYNQQFWIGRFWGGYGNSQYIGETKIDIATNADYTAAQILTAFKRGQSGKHFLETGNEVAWYKFKGNDNTTFLKDETGNNDLTGTGVTQSDDQINLKKYKD